MSHLGPNLSFMADLSVKTELDFLLKPNWAMTKNKTKISRTQYGIQ